MILSNCYIFTHIIMKKLLFISIIAILAACSNKEEKNNNGDYTVKGDTISIDKSSALNAKLRIDTVKTVLYQSKITTTGVVKAIPNNYAEIASPFSGRITKSFVRLGQKVNVGSPIFEISSPSFNETCKIFFQTKQEMLLAEKNLKRQQDLLKNGVGVKKELEEAEVNFEVTKRDYENAIASIEVYNVDPIDIKLGQPLIVRSPIQGEIVQNNIVIGQYLKDDAEPVAVVAELSKVWVVGQLKEKDINSIHESDNIEIKLPCLADKLIAGKVYHVSEMLDEESRSVQVFIECNNTDRVMKPGMYVTVQFYNPTDSVILVPSKSVLQSESTCFVFQHISGHKFVKRPIDIAGTDKDMIILKSGLLPNDEIISEGSFYLMEAI